MRISYTALHTLMTCEYSYYLRYIKRVPTIETSASIYGTAVHRAIHVGYDNNLDRDDWAKVFKQEWVTLASGKDIVFAYDNEYLKKFKGGQQLLLDYYDTFVKNEEKPPPMLEYFFGKDEPIMLGNHNIIGVFDQIDSNGVIIDYKTGVKTTQAKLDLDLQFTLYSYAYRQLFGQEEGGLVLRHLGTMKDMATKRTESDFEILKEEVDKIDKRLKGKLFIRNYGRECANCYFIEHCLGKERKYGRSWK